jgi:hypothetical protein
MPCQQKRVHQSPAFLKTKASNRGYSIAGFMCLDPLRQKLLSHDNNYRVRWFRGFHDPLIVSCRAAATAIFFAHSALQVGTRSPAWRVNSSPHVAHVAVSTDRPLIRSKNTLLTLWRSGSCDSPATDRIWFFDNINSTFMLYLSFSSLVCHR